MKKFLNSLSYAFNGMKDLFLTETNAQIHLVAMFVVLIVGFFFNISKIEWLFVILVIVLVISAEAFNTALEHLTDLVSPEHHPLAGRAKDVAAAAVSIIVIGAIVVGLIIFLPKLIVFITK